MHFNIKSLYNDFSKPRTHHHEYNVTWSKHGSGEQICYWVVITDHVRNMREDNVFTGVCYSVVGPGGRGGGQVAHGLGELGQVRWIPSGGSWFGEWGGSDAPWSKVDLPGGVGMGERGRHYIAMLMGSCLNEMIFYLSGFC